MYHMYHIIMKKQITRLSYERSNMRMGKENTSEN